MYQDETECLLWTATNCQKLTKADKEGKLYTFYGKHRATEVAAYALGEERKDYVVWRCGGKDKLRFPQT